MTGIIIMTVIGFVLSVILVNLSDYLNQEERLEQDYRDLLPGYNCGACGFGSCQGMARMMLKDPDNYKKCKPLRGDALREMETYIRKIKEKE